MNTIELMYVSDEDEEVTLVFPAVMEVCNDCGGHGSVLCEGMRNHAYSREEFEESFDDEEDRQAYFTHGSKYDVACPTCHGKNVVPVVNEEHLNETQKIQYELWLKYDDDRAQSEADDRATMYAENGYRE